MSELDRDPDFFATDILCAVADMAERFSRDDLLKALNGALLPLNIEIVDLSEYRDAA